MFLKSIEKSEQLEPESLGSNILLLNTALKREGNMLIILNAEHLQHI